LYVEDLDEFFSVEISEGTIFCRFWSFVHSHRLYATAEVVRLFTFCSSSRK
jgi:hypothetical protein